MYISMQIDIPAAIRVRVCMQALSSAADAIKDYTNQKSFRRFFTAGYDRDAIARARAGIDSARTRFCQAISVTPILDEAQKSRVTWTYDKRSNNAYFLTLNLMDHDEKVYKTKYYAPLTEMINKQLFASETVKYLIAAHESKELEEKSALQLDYTSKVLPCDMDLVCTVT